MIETALRQHLMAILAAYRSSPTALAEATVERRAAGYTGFFERQRAGRSITARKFDEVVAWFDEHWPADAVWPADVYRPSRDAADLVLRGGSVGDVSVPDDTAPVTPSSPASAPARRGSGLGGLFRALFE